jgi:hypothetical protein
MNNHPFWFLLMIACVVWYSTITIYVAVRGAFDIRHMLDRLGEKQTEATADDSARGQPLL